jgi:hypothetical protein
MSDPKVDSDLQLLTGRLGWGCVAIIGAGLSLPSRYPTTELLEPLLWKAVDADREGRAQLAHDLGQDQRLRAKGLLAADPSALGMAWALIQRTYSARRAFQYGFADLDRERSEHHSPTFDAVARLLYGRVIARASHSILSPLAHDLRGIEAKWARVEETGTWETHSGRRTRGHECRLSVSR